MNCMQIDRASISNGTGVRVVLWCAGCTRKCQGCFNPKTWDFNAGQPFDKDAKKYLFEKLNKPYIQGITFSGGHPLEPQNVKDVYDLIVDIKSKFPDKDIWLYTGYKLDICNFTTIEKGINLTCEEGNCTHHNYIYNILNSCDVVVDGPYIESQRDLTLAFRGSKNQRLIDVKETIKQKQIVIHKV